MSFADRVLNFYQSLKLEVKLPKGMAYMNPYGEEYTFHLCKLFYQKFYADEKERTLILGINPGRFGSGTTGISFTDPIKLEKECGIENTLVKKPELSADFIYAMINEYGGLKKFYSRYFISSVSPLGFTKDGLNINYYDDPRLQQAAIPFIIDSISALAHLGVSKKKCFCLGEGKNMIFLKKINEQHRWFDEIIPLPHPRFIMQYKRKKVHEYISDYVQKLK
jgi:hypothetical protein